MALNYTVSHNGNTWESSTSLDSINVSNGSTTMSITSAGTTKLNCAGKVASNNIVIGAKTLNCAGKIMAGDISIVATTSGLPKPTDLTGTTWRWRVINGPNQPSDFTFTGKIRINSTTVQTVNIQPWVQSTSLGTCFFYAQTVDASGRRVSVGFRPDYGWGTLTYLTVSTVTWGTFPTASDFIIESGNVKDQEVIDYLYNNAIRLA